MMKNNKIIIAAFSGLLLLSACNIPVLVQKTPDLSPLPKQFNGISDSTNSGTLKWQQYFNDPALENLINVALSNNQELNIVLREIEIANNEAYARKGEYKPFVTGGVGLGAEKRSKNTPLGALEEHIDIKEGKKNPEPLPDALVGVNATWEVDIWKKLRNAQKSAQIKYLSTIEGKNFMVTNLIAEIANSYYELVSLDEQLAIVNKNIGILNNAFDVIKVQKEATRVTELAVRKFEAEVLKAKSLQFELKQQIVETENKINFLAGRYPQHIERSNKAYSESLPEFLKPGLPSQLLANRPDIKQAELDLEANKLDVLVAKAQFYPSLGINAKLGLQAFNPAYLVKIPASLLYGLSGDLIAPLINKNAIKANYLNANNRQIQAVYNYERSILNGYIEVANQLSRTENLAKSYELKASQVKTLNASYDLSNELFRNARADYMEVLMTQRDALDAQFELVETRKKQLNAMVDLFHALGGGNSK